MRVGLSKICRGFVTKGAWPLYVRLIKYGIWVNGSERVSACARMCLEVGYKSKALAHELIR